MTSSLTSRLLVLLILPSTQASAEVCLQSWPSCAFHAAFEEVFGGLSLPRPSEMGWPELYQDDDRPVARYGYQVALDDQAYETLASDGARFASALNGFPSAAKSKLCADESTAGFVSAGGIVEIWVGLHPEWNNAEPDPAGLPDKVVIRVDTCEAN